MNLVSYNLSAKDRMILYSISFEDIPDEKQIAELRRILERLEHRGR